MKAKLKELYSPEAYNLAEFCPEEPDNFCILVSAIVGPEDSKGEESFNIQVCTPKWLCSYLDKCNGIMPGRHFLFVLEYDYEKIYDKIKRLIESCSGSNWNEVAEKVARIGHWEFEDYVE